MAWVEDDRVRAFEAMVRHLGGVPVEEPAELLARLGSELPAPTESADSGGTP